MVPVSSNNAFGRHLSSIESGASRAALCSVWHICLGQTSNSRRHIARVCAVGLLAVGLASVSLAEEVATRDNMFQIVQWNGYDAVTTLKDGTSMYSYVAEASSFNANDSNRAEHNAVFRFNFLPRFQCSPMIVIAGALPEDIGEENLITTLKNFNEISVTIDGDTVEFPTLVERKDNLVQSFFDANLQRRTTFRILTELGDVMRVKFGDGTIEEFSLIGSGKTLKQAMARCKNH